MSHRLVSSQKQTSNYDKICPVYSIWVLTSSNNELRNAITNCEMMTKLLYKEDEPYPNDVDYLSPKDGKIINVFVGDYGETKKGILRLLSVCLASSSKCSTSEKIKLLKDEFKILATKTSQQLKLEEDLNSMCNISDYIEQRGKTEGIAIGKTEGIAIGKTEGIAIGKTEGIAIGKTEGIAIGEARGEARGEAIGEARTNATNAIKLHKLGMSPDNIKEVTGFTYEEALSCLEKLENESKNENK